MKSKRFNISTKLLALIIAGLGLAGILSACGSDDDDDVTETTRAQVTTTSTTVRPTTTTRPLAIG